MRTLFYISDETWTGCARTFVTAARGLAERGHQPTVACCGGSVVEQRASEAGLETVPIAADANVAADAWWLRRVLQERFVEVAFVHSEREQFVVSSGMRMAERGAVIRRIAPFQPVTTGATARLAARMAACGVLFSTEADRRRVETPGMTLAPMFAPLGVDAAEYDELRPVPRGDIGVPGTGLVIACGYDPASRDRMSTVLRTLALLAPRHADIHLVVYGPGALEDELRLHAAALGVVQFVTFVGPATDPLPILRAADVSWVVAQGDHGAYALLDSMAMRIPTLCERGPLAELYAADGITGVCLQPGDPSFTASAVAAFLANGERRTATGNAGRTRVEREFPLSAMLDGFEKAAEAAGDRSRWAAR